jgi:hypothetical protein
VLTDTLVSLNDALIWLVETRPLLRSKDNVETLDSSDEIALEIDDDSPGSICAWAAPVPSHDVTPT